VVRENLLVKKIPTFRVTALKELWSRKAVPATRVDDLAVAHSHDDKFSRRTRQLVAPDLGIVTGTGGPKGKAVGTAEPAYITSNFPPL